MKLFKTLFAILLITSLLVSCTQEPPKDNPPDSPQPPPKEEQKGPVIGGEIIIGTSIENLQVDPLGYKKPTSSIYNITPILYRGILKYDEQLKLSTDIASLYEVNEEDKTVQLKLKEDITFADGTPVTVNDVKYSYELYSRGEYNGKWKNFTFHIEGTSDYRRGREEEVLGIVINEDNSITIQYSSLNNEDLQLLLAPILSKNQLKEKTMDQIKKMALSGRLLATGPFELTEQATNQWILEKNDNYRNEIFLNKVIFKNYTANINVDLLFALPQHIKTKDAKEQIKVLDGTGYHYLGMNLNNPIFKDAVTRESIANAIDYKKIIADTFDGYADRPLSLIHPSSWLYQSVNKQQKNEETLSVLKEKQLALELAYSNTQMNQSISQGIKEQLFKYGVTINLKPIAPQEYISDLFYRGDYDLFLAQWPYEYDPLNENYKWLSSKDVLEGGYNVSHIKDPKSDELLLMGVNTLQNEDRKAIYLEWQDYFMKQNYIIPLVSPEMLLLTNENLTFEIKNSMLPYEEIEKWWIKKKSSQ